MDIMYDYHESVAIVLTDQKKKIIWVNNGFQQMTGYSIGDIRGKTPAFLQGLRTEHSAVNRIRHCFSVNIPFAEQVTNYKKDGELYKCLLVVHPIRNECNELTNYIAFELDLDEEAATTTEEKVAFVEKYLTSNLTQSKEVSLYVRLQDFFTKEKPYKDPELTQDYIAKQIGSNTKYLSQVINHQTGNNFRWFVNQYRVEAFKQQLLDKAHKFRTLFGIAADCGFKNKATFYRVIQLHTNKTPKELLEELCVTHKVEQD